VNRELHNVFLIGYRCTGKTSVGNLLAAKLNWPYIDTDSLLVAENGASIKEIVATHGWEAFRKMEHTILKNVCTLKRQVVATGGGIVLDDTNVHLMRQNGRLIWLKATPKTIRARMMRDQDTEDFRPSLTSKDRLSEIEETLEERVPLYKLAMDFRVETDGRRIDEICEAVIQQLLNEAQ